MARQQFCACVRALDKLLCSGDRKRAGSFAWGAGATGEGSPAGRQLPAGLWYHVSQGGNLCATLSVVHFGSFRFHGKLRREIRTSTITLRTGDEPTRVFLEQEQRGRDPVRAAACQTAHGYPDHLTTTASYTAHVNACCSMRRASRAVVPAKSAPTPRERMMSPIARSELMRWSLRL